MCGEVLLLEYVTGWVSPPLPAARLLPHAAAPRHGPVTWATLRGVRECACAGGACDAVSSRGVGYTRDAPVGEREGPAHGAHRAFRGNGERRIVDIGPVGVAQRTARRGAVCGAMRAGVLVSNRRVRSTRNRAIFAGLAGTVPTTSTCAVFPAWAGPWQHGRLSQAMGSRASLICHVQCGQSM